MQGRSGPGWELVPRHFCRCHEPKPSLSRTRNQSEGGVLTPRRREEGNERVLTANRPHAVKHANAPQLPAANTGRPAAHTVNRAFARGEQSALSVGPENEHITNMSQTEYRRARWRGTGLRHPPHPPPPHCTRARGGPGRGPRARPRLPAGRCWAQLGGASSCLERL